ncbi:toprim domain-containing protein [Maribacter aquivivus]|uniref:toprim domain-containing protein n=1 Tax=Maribacter aquivivus TaxID=228958 RepID=UPI002493F398|nr:toprim domain-containing protein [Maribacter aquivivus]
MKEKRITCRSARNFCLVKILENLGHFPTRKTEKEAWFLSPFRSETQASFKISLALNRWYDHGMGKGGNSIDLLSLLLNFSVKEVLTYLSNDLAFSFHQPPLKIKETKKTQILTTKTISHPALLTYLKNRKVSLEVSRQYLKEVTFEQSNKALFALGLENHLGGWELRNKFQKTSSSPKSYSWLKRDKKQLILTEGMFDFLSIATINPTLVSESDILILNSIAFLSDIEPLLSNYDKVRLYLDNDNAGNSTTEILKHQFNTTVDCRHGYKGYKDLNEKIIAWN